MELARFELATSWVRSTRNSFPLVPMLRHLARLGEFRQFALAVLRHVLSREFDHRLTTAGSRRRQKAKCAIRVRRFPRGPLALKRAGPLGRFGSSHLAHRERRSPTEHESVARARANARRFRGCAATGNFAVLAYSQQ